MLVVAVVLAAAGCESTLTTVAPCSRDEDCLNGQVCNRARCVPRLDELFDDEGDDDAEGDDAAPDTADDDPEVDPAPDDAGDDPDVVPEDGDESDDEGVDDAPDAPDDDEALEPEPEPDVEPPPPPVGDTCAGAGVLPVGTPVSLDTTGARDDFNPGASTTCTCVPRAFGEGCDPVAQPGPDTVYRIDAQPGDVLAVSVTPRIATYDVWPYLLTDCAAVTSCFAGDTKQGTGVRKVIVARVSGPVFLVLDTPYSRTDEATSITGPIDVLVTKVNAAEQCGRCTALPGGSPELYACPPDFGCVATQFDGRVVERACLKACAREAECPPLHQCRAVTDGLGNDLRRCVPAYRGANTATCAGYLDARTKRACAPNPDYNTTRGACGADTEGAVDDGSCIAPAPGSAGYCSWRCNAEVDCLPGWECADLFTDFTAQKFCRSR